MHIPDGYLGPPTYGSLWAAMVLVWLYALKKVKATFSLSHMPFLAMASAFSLIVMIFAIPLPGGTSAHLSGAALIAILFGPWAAVIAVSVALTIQAFVFGEGGITALGANCFNIAFTGSITGYGLYRLLTGIGSMLGRNKLFFQVMGAGIGVYMAVNLGALLTALELGIQPLLHAGYFPYPLKIVVPAIMIPHLVAIGIIEAVVTIMVFMAVQRLHLTKNAEKPVLAILSMIIILSASSASAHDFWIEQSRKGYRVVYGHGSHREDYEPEKVKAVKAFDAQGRAVTVSKEKKEKGIVLFLSEHPSLIVVEIDNGYCSKTIYGWKNLPKRKAGRVIEAFRSIYYSKTIISWSDASQKPVEGIVLDIVPMMNLFEIKDGESLPIKVVLNNRPLSEASIMGHNHEKLAVTDKEGVAKIPVAKGHNLVTVTYKEAVKGDPDADFMSITATLTFEVKR